MRSKTTITTALIRREKLTGTEYLELPEEEITDQEQYPI